MFIKSNHRSTVLFLLVFFLLTSAVCSNGETIKQEKNYLEENPLGVIRSRTPIGNLNAMIIFLADQLERNVDFQDVSSPIIVTSFPNLDNLKETSRLGRLISETLMHELQVRKWAVLDIRIMNEVVMNDDGEFSLSRDIKRVKEQYHIGGIVTGTYSYTPECIVINARLINPQTGIVLSTAQVSLPYAGIESLLVHYSQPKPMKIAGDNGPREEVHPRIIYEERLQKEEPLPKKVVPKKVIHKKKRKKEPFKAEEVQKEEPKKEETKKEETK
ncbi:MAG: hypothetical protein HQK89_05530 [Nitrospirae bacterium]|nr:hypothetical protein [Nitrospirota bacterium]